MGVVYVDSVFVLNTAMDYILLLSTARLAGVTMRRWRYAAAAVLGGLYAVSVFLPGLSVLSHPLIKGATGVVLAIIAFGCEENLLRLTVLFLAVSCAMAGCVLGLGLLAQTRVPSVGGIFFTNVDTAVLLVAAAAAYLLWSVVFRASAKHRVEGNLLPVRLCIGNTTLSLTALWDSGNGLQDSVSGASVLIVDSSVLRACTDATLHEALTKMVRQDPGSFVMHLRQKAPWLHPRLLPYHAVGVSRGLLPVITAEWGQIGESRIERLPVAVSPTGLGGTYSALWGGEVKRRHGDDGISEKPVGAAGSYIRHSLYRRK